MAVLEGGWGEGGGEGLAGQDLGSDWTVLLVEEGIVVLILP